MDMMYRWSWIRKISSWRWKGWTLDLVVGLCKGHKVSGTHFDLRHTPCSGVWVPYPLVPNCGITPMMKRVMLETEWFYPGF